MSEWQQRLDERQRKEVALARLYAADFAHGTLGHHQLLLIAHLADLLDAALDDLPPTLPPAPASRGHLCPVPYHSQHEADAQWLRKDCGPACVEMIGEYFTPATDVTTNEIMQFITHGVDRGVYIRELQRAAEHFYGVILDRHDGASWDDLVGWLEDDRPPIVLVHYGSFAARMDRAYTAGHFMVVCGWDEVDYQGQTVKRALVHDPDWWGSLMAQGAFLPVAQDHFVGMWDDAHKDRGNPRRMALVPRK